MKKVRYESEWMDHTRLDKLEKCPRFSLRDGKRVTNPYVYCVMQAMEGFAGYIPEFELDGNSEIIIHVRVKEFDCSFKAVAEGRNHDDELKLKIERAS